MQSIALKFLLGIGDACPSFFEAEASSSSGASHKKWLDFHEISSTVAFVRCNIQPTGPLN
jgi:hypothetical protein